LARREGDWSDVSASPEAADPARALSTEGRIVLPDDRDPLGLNDTATPPRLDAPPGKRRVVEVPPQREDQHPEPDRKRGDKPRRRVLRRHTFALAVGLLVCILAATAGYLYWDYAQHFESTDDAFIAARAFSIAPRVSGYITAVLVTDNQHVAAGEAIARIDDRDYRVALDQAQAQVANAEANIQNIDACSACRSRSSSTIRRPMLPSAPACPSCPACG
jgi:Biotin-lipoyl like